MLTLAYVHAADADIATGFFMRESLAGGAEFASKTIVVAEHHSLPVGMALANRFDLGLYVLPPSPDHPDAVLLRPLLDDIAREGANAAILSESMPFQMVFRDGETTPAYNEQFDAIRILHALGVRQFRFVGRQAESVSTIPYLLDNFVGCHRGERAFVIGNGPSLRQIDMGKLKNEITFGSNRCFLGYEDWGFAFKYWGISDRLQIEMYKDEYEAGVDRESIKFFPFEYLDFLKVENACPCEIISDVAFGDDKWLRFPHFGETPRTLFMSFTVTITLIQIAALMGCNPIILVGVDHNYPIARIKRHGKDEAIQNPAMTAPISELSRRSRLGWDFWEGNAATGTTHFTDKYVTNKIFVPPRTPWAETVYDYSRLWGDYNGVEILNATPGSHLDSYRKIDFTKLF